MSKTVNVTLQVSKTDNAAMRDYCSQFDERMSGVLTKLILWAMDNAPIETRPLLDLGDIGSLPMNETKRALRGAKPAKRK